MQDRSAEFPIYNTLTTSIVPVSDFQNQIFLMLVERVGDVLEKGKTEYDVLVLCGVHVTTEFVGRRPDIVSSFGLGASFFLEFRFFFSVVLLVVSASAILRP